MGGRGEDLIDLLNKQAGDLLADTELIINSLEYAINQYERKSAEDKDMNTFAQQRSMRGDFNTGGSSARRNLTFKSTGAKGPVRPFPIRSLIPSKEEELKSPPERLISGFGKGRRDPESIDQT